MTQKEHDEKVNDLKVSLVESEKRIQDIKKELDELDKVKIEPESRRWKPNRGQTYYFIGAVGSVICTTWYNSSDDLHRFAIGNVFKTKEEAEFVVERLKIIAELKEFAEPDDAEWDKLPRHYSIYYDSYFKSVRTCCDSIFKFSVVHFESEEKAKEAIKAVGEDRIKKYYLRVKENQKKAETEIKVGDEVIVPSGKRCVVTGFNSGDNKWILCIDENGDCGPNYHEKTDLKKTGRHFPQIEEVLKQMKGE